MKNYRKQNGCHNCKFHITKEYEPNEPIYFCNYDGSLDYINKTDANNWPKLKKSWGEIRDKVVDEAGICDLHELKIESKASN